MWCLEVETWNPNNDSRSYIIVEHYYFKKKRNAVMKEELKRREQYMMWKEEEYDSDTESSSVADVSLEEVDEYIKDYMDDNDGHVYETRIYEIVTED